MSHHHSWIFWFQISFFNLVSVFKMCSNEKCGWWYHPCLYLGGFTYFPNSFVISLRRKLGGNRARVEDTKEQSSTLWPSIRAVHGWDSCLSMIYGNYCLFRVCHSLNCFSKYAKCIPIVDVEAFKSRKCKWKMSKFEEGEFGHDLWCLMLQDQLNVMIP